MMWIEETLNHGSHVDIKLVNEEHELQYELRIVDHKLRFEDYVHAHQVGDEIHVEFLFHIYVNALICCI